jgi:hypothetical protein
MSQQGPFGFTITNTQHKVYFAYLFLKLLNLFLEIKFEIEEPF